MHGWRFHEAGWWSHGKDRDAFLMLCNCCAPSHVAVGRCSTRFEPDTRRAQAIAKHSAPKHSGPTETAFWPNSSRAHSLAPRLPPRPPTQPRARPHVRRSAPTRAGSAMYTAARLAARTPRSGSRAQRRWPDGGRQFFWAVHGNCFELTSRGSYSTSILVNHKVTRMDSFQQS